jgi:hypothetical protein
MTVPNATQLESVAAALKKGAGKLADLLKQQAELKVELEAAANDAEATGLADFADVLRDMAAKLGALAVQNGRPAAPAARRRGRPPKPAEEQPPVT